MDMKAIMKQAQAMQAELAKKQEGLAKQQFDASSGGGMVLAKVNGKHELVSLKIDPSIISASDTEMLQDLVIAAVNDGVRKADEAAKEIFAGMMPAGMPF